MPGRDVHRGAHGDRRQHDLSAARVLRALRVIAAGSELSSRARKAILLALLPLAAIAVLAGVRNASAHWQRASARSVGSPRVRITSNRVTGLYPGATGNLVLTLRNRSRHRLVVRRIRVRIVSTTKPGCEPSPSNLAIRQPSRRKLRLRPRGRRRVTVQMAMPNSVADACQGAVFKLRYTARTR